MFQKKQNNFIGSFENLEIGSLFVHSDAMKTMQLIKLQSSRDAILNEHILLLKKINSGQGLLFPTFNYQFPKTRKFDLRNTPSEVGHISEFYRKNFSSWRTKDPMFSVCGNGQSLANENEVQCPFDNSSVFAHIIDNNGYLLFYGADFSSATIIHHIEFKMGVNYRYWKTFEGRLNDGITSKKVILSSHFRPMKMHLDYDFPRLLSDLYDEKLINNHFSNVIGCQAKLLSDFWMLKLKDDPLYLLNKESRDWVTPMLDKLGRGFIQSDFEEVSNDRY